MKHPRARYSDQLPYVIDTVSRRAEKGDVRAMNLFLHFVGVDPRAKASACTETTRPTLRNYLRMGGGNLRFQPGWRKRWTAQEEIQC
jgi:hypothetical protein